MRSLRTSAEVRFLRLGHLVVPGETMAATTKFSVINTSLIAESPLNPRKEFDEEKLAGGRDE